MRWRIKTVKTVTQSNPCSYYSLIDPVKKAQSRVLQNFWKFSSDSLCDLIGRLRLGPAKSGAGEWGPPSPNCSISRNCHYGKEMHVDAMVNVGILPPVLPFSGDR